MQALTRLISFSSADATPDEIEKEIKAILSEYRHPGTVVDPVPGTGYDRRNLGG